MRRLAVICASPPHFNPGMHSVDLAFWNLVQRHQIAGDVRFYCLPDVEPSVQTASDLPFVYQNAYDELADICESDAIVYWGDFLHSRIYVSELMPRLVAQWPHKRPDDLRTIGYAVFLLEHVKRIRGRIIIFGGNLSILDSSSFADSRYIPTLTNLYQQSSITLMRDPYSAIAVNHLTGNYEKSYCGVDCAFLLNDAPAASMYRKRLSNEGPLSVGIFAGRSWYYGAYFQFCRRVCAQLGAKGVWIPWFHHRPPPLMEQYSDVFDVSARDVGFNGTMRLLDECSLVLSDTYHLCVNAWARGIPAICVGRGVGAMRYTIDDKKKELLYGMMGVSNLHVYAESLLVTTLGLDVTVSYGQDGQMIDALCKAVLCPIEMQKAFERIDAARFSAEARLVQTLASG